MLHHILSRTNKQILSKRGIQSIKTVQSAVGSCNTIDPQLQQQQQQQAPTPILKAITTTTSLTTTTTTRCYHSTTPSYETVNITFLDPLEKEHTVPAEVGKSLLDVAHDNNIELEGACGGELACATCHLIFSQEMYDTLSEKEPEEDDMLDLAFELTDTSRLGCQICVRKDMEGMVVRIPDDGY